MSAAPIQYSFVWLPDAALESVVFSPLYEICRSSWSAKNSAIDVRSEMCKTFLLSFENHSQNVPLPNPKMHYGAIFQPAIPRNRAEGEEEGPPQIATMHAKLLGRAPSQQPRPPRVMKGAIIYHCMFRSARRQRQMGHAHGPNRNRPGGQTAFCWWKKVLHRVWS